MSTEFHSAPARVAVVETEIEIAAPREAVYRTFVEDIGSWFYESEESRKTRRAILEPTLGGRFYVRDEAGEKAGDENLLAIVTLLRPGRKLRLRGDFTIPQAVTANATIAFEDAGSGTRISVSHHMAGEFDDDLPRGFEEGWRDGLEKLKKLVQS